MPTQPPLLSALALVRPALLDLLQTAHNPESPLGQLASAELARNSYKAVQESLLAGDVLKAANSAFGNKTGDELKGDVNPWGPRDDEDTFVSRVSVILAPVLHPVAAAIATDLEEIFSGERRYRATFKQGMTSHLPKVHKENGFIPEAETRALLSEALDDAVILALWVMAQTGRGDSNAYGFLTYAVGNSCFVSRTGFYADVSVPIETEVDGKIVSPLDRMVSDEHTAQPVEESLEWSIFQLTRAHLGHAPVGPVFNAFYGQLLLRPTTKLDCLSKRERTSLGERYVLDAQEVQRIGDAMMHALRALQGLRT